MGPDSEADPAVPWRKVLWQRQPFPDNYVGQRFLEELRRNEGLHQYHYWTVVKEASIVGQQLSCVAIFITLWLYMEQSLLPPETLLWTSLLTALLGYGLHQLLSTKQELDCKPRTHLANLQSATIFLSFTFGFSPVLKTLTESVSTDTVYAMSAMMLLAHLMSFPYTQPSPPGSLSLNAALFASVCLASRLPGALHTFAMLSCALLVFALWPCLLQKMRERSPYHFTVVCVGVCIGGVAGLGSQSSFGAVLLTMALSSVTLLCPLLLVRLQQQKDNITGPWDEAEIHEDISQFAH
ncbi:phosphatidylinositol N-acetylglucosaminyltransferase subunit C [Eucyclogobius newberryi]|uniref:phosphatidylinositol N-acetylglucosaminyltransferase subunit C n=1 Tax=Eucyclogobius newberryi TaxID=166745 RepID=UPI003B5A6DFB